MSYFMEYRICSLLINDPSALLPPACCHELFRLLEIHVFVEPLIIALLCRGYIMHSLFSLEVVCSAL